MSKRVEQVFSERAMRGSESAAIKIGERQVSYGELDKLSNRLARRLIQQGVGRNCIVAVATGNIEHFAVAVLAILKAGAAYLSIDTRYPVERVRDILTDAAPANVAGGCGISHGTDSRWLARHPRFRAKRTRSMHIPHLSIERMEMPTIPPASITHPDRQGRPKGIEVAHRGIPGLVSDLDFVPFGPMTG